MMRYGAERNCVNLNEQGDVYFIQCGDDGPIKIGKSRDPKGRLAAMMPNNPFELRLLRTMKGGHSLERLLHWRFAPIRLRGEWFAPTSELLHFIAHGRLVPQNKRRNFYQVTELPDMIAVLESEAA